MTEQQLSAAKSLATRFGSDLEHTDILHNPFDLPKGWISIVVHDPDTDAVKIVGGISPEGRIST